MDYTILAPPRITLHRFRHVLEAAGSPAASSAAAAYASAVDYGVDPAVLLAVFHHESNYGRAGVAVRTRGWGNLRTSPSYPSSGGFAVYPSWAAGARDTARLLRVYGLNRIRPNKDTSTVRTFPYVWAPAGDGGNRPASYGDALMRDMRAWVTADGKHRRLPTHPTHRTPFAGVRLRRAPALSSPIVRTVDAGTEARVQRKVAGAGYRLPNGSSGHGWYKVVALNGHRLGTPLYSASLLWVAL